MSNQLAHPVRQWPALEIGHPLTRGLVGYWPFWEGQGGQVADVWSPWDIGNHGTWAGSGTHWAASELGWCGDFAGGAAKDCVDFAASINLGKLSTEALWIRFDAIDATGTMLFGEADFAYDYHVYLKAAGNLYWTLDDRPKDLGHSFAIGRWYHLVFVRDTSTSVRMYVDGELYNTASDALWATIDTEFDKIGAESDGSNSYPLNGQIVSAAVWERPLTEVEVKCLHGYGRYAGFHARRVFPAAAAAGNPWWYYRHASLGAA